MLKLVERSGLRRGRQPERAVERAGLEARLRRGQRTLRPSRRVLRQRDRALQERGRRGQAPTPLGAAGRALQLGGDVLVGPRRGMGPVPGAAVGIKGRVGGPDLAVPRGALLKASEFFLTGQRSPEPPRVLSSAP